MSQKYPKEIVTQGIKKASVIPLDVLHSKKAKENKEVLFPNLRPLIRARFDSF